METKILDLGAINGQVSVQKIRKKIKVTSINSTFEIILTIMIRTYS